MNVFEKINQEGEPLFKLVTREPHRFGQEQRVPANPVLGRHQQTERACPRCGLVKITVHPPEGPSRREFRWGNAPTQFTDVMTPECVPTASDGAAA
ncbi:MAG TPA: hypothetical protein VEU47_18835 [Candidatus Cybelea sp.]|nr:hypothetical protein [Candidatus Cybelea sp.]